MFCGSRTEARPAGAAQLRALRAPPAQPLPHSAAAGPNRTAGHPHGWEGTTAEKNQHP